MKKILIAFATLVVVASSCEKLDIQPSSIFGDKRVSAQIETSDTRATLNEETKFMNWENGDKIAINDGVSFKEYTLDEGEGTSIGKFTGEELAEADAYVAVYPASTGLEVSVAENVYTITGVSYPSTIKYEDGKAEGNANVMVGVSKSKEISLKNACGYLALKFESYSQDMVITSVEISAKGEGDIYVAGNATITVTKGIPSVAIAAEGGSKTITIDCGTAGISIAKLCKMIVALPPVFTEGFKVKLNVQGADPVEFTSSVAIGRNDFVDMQKLHFNNSGLEAAVIKGETKTTYSTFADALTAANADAACTLQLLNDVTLEADATVTNTNGITLDLNGFTVTVDVEKQFEVDGGTLTIDDSSVSDPTLGGKIYAVYNTEDPINNASVFVKNKGTVNVVGGQFGYLSGSTGVGKNYTSAAIKVTDGSFLNVTGGYIKNRESAIRVFDGSVARISGGTVTNGSQGYTTLTAKGEDSKIYVTGGKIISNYNQGNNGTICSALADSEEEGAPTSAKIYISGGSFNIPRISKEYLTDGNGTNYAFVLDDNKEFTVENISSETDFDASVTSGDKEFIFKNLKAAFQFASVYRTMTIDINRDITLTEKLTLNNDMSVVLSSQYTTIDFNGHVITTDKATGIEVNSNLTLKDSDPNHTGGITNTNTETREEAYGGCALFFSADGGGFGKKQLDTLTIEGGNFNGKYTFGTVRVASQKDAGAKGLVIINGENTTMTNDGDGPAFNIGYSTSTDIANVTINNGKFVSTSDSAAVKCTYGTLTIAAGEFIGPNALSVGKGTKNVVAIDSGYFYSTKPDSEVFRDHATPRLTGKVFGGYFNKSIPESLIAEGKMLKTLEAPVSYHEKEYGYQVIVNSALDPVASVNGINYTSFKDAIDAAVEYSGETDSVLVTLLKDVACNIQYNLTNNGNKNFCLDINGKTLSVSVDSCFSSAGTLRIMDSGTIKGRITTSARRLFVKNTLAHTKKSTIPTLGGSLYLDGCVIESTCAESGCSGSGTTSTVISLLGTSGNSPKLVMMNGAKINKLADGKAIAVRFSTFDMINSEINCYKASDSDSSGWCVYIYATSTVNISGSSLYSEVNACLQSGTSKATININEGTYLFSGGDASYCTCIHGSGDKNTNGNFNLNKGSFYNKNVSEAKASKTVAEGCSLAPTTKTAYGRTYTYTVIEGEPL